MADLDVEIDSRTIRTLLCKPLDPTYASRKLSGILRQLHAQLSCWKLENETTKRARLKMSAYLTEEEKRKPGRHRYLEGSAGKWRPSAGHGHPPFPLSSKNVDSSALISRTTATKSAIISHTHQRPGFLGL